MYASASLCAFVGLLDGQLKLINVVKPDPNTKQMDAINT